MVLIQSEPFYNSEINLSSIGKMENYTEWNNNKMYEGHVRRLTEIKEK